ncbi:Olfactory receptor 51I1 [Cricetulus griseus]|uniref:Olfactory receptor 51I1 n=1 Tax=Cricetulus griseus TaxID=10029 RepID=G3ICN3_CRIGR|nr:Olfactory receptor 51I1 [Cricetulus griseus]
MESGVLLAMSVDPFVTIYNPLRYTTLLTLPNIIQLPCGDTCPNSILGLCIMTSTFGLDSRPILVSRVLIVYTALNITSGEGRRKALNTCASHMCTVLVYYVPKISVAVVHRLMKHTVPAVPLFLANIYILVRPMLNPIIYSAKNKQVREGLLQLFLQRKY